MPSEQDAVPNIAMQSNSTPRYMGHGVKPEVVAEIEQWKFEVGSDTGLLPNTSQEIESMKLQILDLQSKLLRANISQKSTEQQLSDLKSNFEHLSNQAQSYQSGENLANRLNQFQNRKPPTEIGRKNSCYNLGAHEDGTCHKIDTDNQDYLT
jgi:TolA-binding protein